MLCSTHVVNWSSLGPRPPSMSCRRAPVATDPCIGVWAWSCARTQAPLEAYFFGLRGPTVLSVLTSENSAWASILTLGSLYPAVLHEELHLNVEGSFDTPLFLHFIHSRFLT